MLTKISKKIIGVKELRNNLEEYISEINKGQSFTVIKRSKPVFQINPIDDEGDQWEEVVDFTKIKKGGIEIGDLLSRI